jgi:peptidoglycan hydrolase-like protein with peptidoglycan-binding domain
MRSAFGKGNFRGLILAAMTAGVFGLPAAAAANTQSTSTPAHKPAAHKKATSTAAHRTSSSTAKKPTTSAHPSTASAAAKPTKSTRGSATSRKKTKKVKGQEAPTTDRINEIQQALSTKGVLTATPSGKWDDNTVSAMKKFQSSHGLEPSGKLDALTLQKLGLGSQTAGLAAPKAPANWTNRLRNPKALNDDQPTSEEPSN